MKKILFQFFLFFIFFGCTKDDNKDDGGTIISKVYCWKSISGSSHSVSIQSDGSLWSWGMNTYGQLGDGTYDQKNSPVQILKGTSWKKVSAGRDHTLAIKSDGTLWAWGSNDDYQLGINLVLRNKNIPTQIGTDNDWESISSGYSYCLAIKNNGTLWAWGYNDSGCLGLGTDNQLYASPTQVGTSKWKYVSGGARHSLGIQEDGTLWAWGNNINGQIGDGKNRIYYNSPIKISNQSNWLVVSSGADFSLALKSDGTIWSWGKNDGGQLGHGNRNEITIPSQIGNEVNWKTISTGFGSAVALKTDGSLWVWGDGLILIPSRVGNDTNWEFATSGWFYVAAIKKDNSLWTWGYNFLGQLGDGTNIDKNIPTFIGCQ